MSDLSFEWRQWQKEKARADKLQAELDAARQSRYRLVDGIRELRERLRGTMWSAQLTQQHLNESRFSVKQLLERARQAEVERENSLLALQILLDGRGCLTLENEIEIPEEISAEFDCGLIQAQQVIDAYNALARKDTP